MSKKSVYLQVVCKAQPKQGTNTSKAGWIQRDGFNVVEEINFVDRITDKLLGRSSVVIDVLEKKCVKSGITIQMRLDVPSLPSDETIVEHYMARYKPQIDQTLDFYSKSAR